MRYIILKESFICVLVDLIVNNLYVFNFFSLCTQVASTLALVLFMYTDSKKKK